MMRQIQTGLTWLLFVVVGLAIGFWFWLRLTPSKSLSPTTPTHKAVTVYIPIINGTETEYKEYPLPVGEGRNPYMVAFNYLIGKSVEVPKGTRLLSARLEEDTLVLDFSSELTREFEGGSDAEAALINAILKTAGGLREVNKVLILIEGKPAETLGGHIDITMPLPVEREAASR